MQLDNLLQAMVNREASDLYLTCNAPIMAKIHGRLIALSSEKLFAAEVANLVYQAMDKEQIQRFELEKPEANLALSRNGIGRFRINVFKQRNQVAAVVRHIKTEIPHWKTLAMPSIITRLVMQKRGLVLFVGATGAGKSTTLASMIDYRNQNAYGHIITIEDPIEFMHTHHNSLINQREVGVDTNCYEDALENALRQSPDMIVVSEIRNQTAMEHALNFSETGHLCLSTLHAANAGQALERIINFFPDERRKQILMDLSLNLKGIVSQRLIPSLNKKRVAAYEILLTTPLVCELIKKGEVTKLKDVMTKSEHIGMQTFDTALFRLYKQGLISIEEALRNADSRNNLKLKITLDQGLTPSDNESDSNPLLQGSQLELEAIELPEPEPEEDEEDLMPHVRDISHNKPEQSQTNDNAENKANNKLKEE